MTVFDASILGVVEGLTEFLPVSSTGHLILAEELLGIADTDFVKSFDIAIQLGAILAVIAVYWRSFLRIPVLTRLFVAFVPTGIIGLLAYHALKTYLLGNIAVVLAALFLGGIVLIVLEQFHTDDPSATTDIGLMPHQQAFWVGLAQAVAIIPGVSRSAATISGGLLLGVSRATIVEFSFLLAVPTMLAATGLDLLKSYSLFTASDAAALAVGFILSFVVALLSIRFLLSYMRRHTFTAFGIYRIIVSLILALVFFI